MSIFTPTKSLTSFYHNGELYIRLVPVKKLFQSTMVHEVVNRGSVFAMRVSDQALTVVSGKADVVHTVTEITKPLTLPTPTVQSDMFGYVGAVI